MTTNPARTLRLVLAYDGTDFHGWQRQAGVRTVQEEVEVVARRVIGEPLHVVGASRTDAGVHARGQTAHIRCQSTIPAWNLQRAIGDRLPPDVGLLHVGDAPPGFDAIRSARGKRYRYSIWNATRRPVSQLAGRYHWHVRYPLDADAIRRAARPLIGTHDFTSFATTGSPRESNVRTVQRIAVATRGPELQIDVFGTGFLYNQVRNMVGTLIEIGRGHWAPERTAEILAARDRRAAGPTAPPEGLCLAWVAYPPDAEIGDDT